MTTAAVPGPGGGPVLHAAGRALGRGEAERPFLPRAFSVLRAPAESTQLQFMIEDVGPGTDRLAELEPGDELRLVGPLGIGFARPRDGAAAAAGRRRRRDRSAGHLAGPARARDARAARLPRRPPRRRGRSARRRPRGHRRRQRRPPRDRDRPARRRARPRPPRRGVRLRAAGRCSRRSGSCAPVATIPAQLALESGMACGFGACFGCVVPTKDGLRPAVRRRAGARRPLAGHSAASTWCAGPLCRTPRSAT